MENNFHWLNLDFGRAEFYEYSPTPRPGFESHISEKSKKETFRFYYNNGIIGEFVGVSSRKNQALNREELILQMRVADHVFNIQVPLYNGEKTSYSNYAEDIIRRVGQMKTGETYKCFGYIISSEQRTAAAIEAGFSPKGKYRDKKGLAIGTCDENGDDYKKLEAVDLPKIEFKERGEDRVPTATSIEARMEAAEVIWLAKVDACKEDIIKGSARSYSGPTRIPTSSSKITDSPNGQPDMEMAGTDTDPLF